MSPSTITVGELATEWHRAREAEPLWRDAVFMNRADAARLGLTSGAPVVLESSAGHFDGTVHLADIARQSLQVVWPEGNVLMSAGISDRESGIPDYNAVVTIWPR